MTVSVVIKSSVTSFAAIGGTSHGPISCQNLLITAKSAVLEENREYMSYCIA